MKCIIKTIERDKVHSLGEHKEIVVESHEWQQDGHLGKSYSYHLSKERFERPITKAYEVIVSREGSEAGSEKEGTDQTEQEEFRICTIGYYDFIDYNYEDCVGERRLTEASNQLGIRQEELCDLIDQPLRQLQEKIREEFAQTQEYRAKKEHEEVISNHKRAKREFTMQLGFSETDYDRCYNVYGHLMDADYLEHLQQILREREESKKQSKKYRKEYYRSRFNEYSSASAVASDYSEEEKEMLAKFYKVLAKKYHPDSNPESDTHAEMMLLNKIKKSWNV